MPDPKRLASFLQRTQQAMQDAVTKGDQQSVDQYENFLDRGNALGEKMVGMAGPGGQQGPTGLAGMTPPGDTPPPPQLGASNAPPEGHVNTLVGGTPPIADDRNGETANPFTLAGVGKPQSTLDQIMKGVPKAPPTVYSGPTNADTSGYVPKDPSAPPGRATWRLPTFGEFGKAAFPGLYAAGKALMPSDSQASELSQGVQDIGESMDPSLKANLGQPYHEPQLELDSKRGTSDNPGVGQEQFGDPETKLSLDDALKNTQDKPDIQAELLKLKQQLGNKPTFFTLENLAMLLLMGAPKTYAHFKGSEDDWKKSNMAIDQMGMQYQFGKAGDATKAAHFAQDEKLRRDELNSRERHNIASTQQKPILDEMKDIKSQMRTIMMNPSFDPGKPDSPLMKMLTQLQFDYQGKADEANGVPSTVYKAQPKK